MTPPPGGSGSLWRLTAIRHLLLYALLGFTGFSLTMSALPLWAVQQGTATEFAGLVTTVMLVATVLTQLLMPSLVRRFGLAPVLTIGLVALGAPAPLLYFSHDLGWLLALSAVRGCGFATITVLGSTITTRIVPASRRGEAIGIYGLGIAVSNLIAVPLGVLLATAGQFFWVAMLAAAPLLAIAVTIPLARAAAAGPGSRADAPTNPAVPPADLTGPPADSPFPPAVRPGPAPGPAPDGAHSTWAAVIAVLAPSMVLLAATLAMGGLQTFLPIVRPSGAVATLSLLVFGLTTAAARWRAGVLADRVGVRLLLPLSSGTAMAGLVILALGLSAGLGGSGATLIVLGSAIFGLGYGALQNLTLLIAFARAGARYATTASSIWNAAFDGGTAIGATALGAAAVAIGFPWAFAACAILVALTIPIAVSTARSVRR